MRATSIGHAGILIETAAGSILCDPWFVPAFFGSWFPFPRNDQLERRPARSDRARRLPLHLAPPRRSPRRAVAARAPPPRHPDPAARAFRPASSGARCSPSASPSSSTRSTPRSWRSRPASRSRSTSRSSITDGPGGDSALVVIARRRDPRQPERLPHQRSRPAASARPGRSALAAVLRARSGIRWCTRCPRPTSARSARRRSTAQFARAMRYVEKIDARAVVPSAGPPASSTRSCSGST